jgi:hypothetical protein
LVWPFANGLKHRYLHLAGAFELPYRVILKLSLGLRGLDELFTTLKAGNNNHLGNSSKRRYLHLAGVFEFPNRVILKLFLGGSRGLGELFTTLKAGNNDHFCHMFELPNGVILKLFSVIIKLFKAPPSTTFHCARSQSHMQLISQL